MENLTPSLPSRATYFAASNASPGKLPSYDLRSLYEHRQQVHKIDLDVLRDIIHRASLSPDGDSFLSVFRAYDTVLKERSIDPSQDRLYFKILLKLARIKGGSWYEKLQLVLGTLGVTEEDITATITSQRTPPSPLQHHRVRRVLFKDLPSQSRSISRLDQVVDNPFPTPPSTCALSSSKPAPPPLPDPPTSPDLNLPLIRYYLSAWRLKTTHRVHLHRQQYTYAIERDHRALLAEAFVSWREKSKFFRLLQKRASKARSIIIVEKSLSKWRSRYNNRSQDHRDLADYFNSIFLLRSCLKKWRYRISNDTHKGKLFLLDLMLQKWKCKYTRIKKLECQAEALYRRYLLALSWKDWFFKTCQTRATIYYNLKLAGKAVIVWINWTREAKILEIRADRVYRENIKRDYLNIWIKKLRVLQDMKMRASMYHEAKVIRYALDNWKRDTKLRKAATGYRQKIDEKLIQDCFVIWLWQLRENQKGSEFHRNVLISKYLIAWERQARLKQVTREVESNITFRLFHFWITQERAVLLGRVRDCRLVRDALAVWRNRYQNIRDTLYVVEKTVILNTEFRVQKKTFKNWKDRLRKSRETECFANKIYQRSILMNALSLWKTGIEVVRKLECEGERACNLFLFRNALKTWKQAKQRSIKRSKEARKMLARKHHQRRTQSLIMELWMSRLSKIRYLEAQADHAKTLFDESVTRIFLSGWRSSFQTYRGLENMARKIYEEQLLRASVSSWIDNLNYCTEIAAIADMTFSAKLYDIQVKCLRIWRRNMFRFKGLDVQAELMLRQCQGRLIRLAFRGWARKVREGKTGNSQENIHGLVTPTRPIRSWRLGRSR
ncbi:Protein sfi1 [Neolecta irregularis DAH-3]|uniref:Protein sfi1 n=1 Tax=Neolecta irregularis (strain DAH-3) TaxID=1198029 RepID=A0A1U7LT17_NEOID|nr:Protein sfi1 [Neolecta irregularis DAH-3]|eukprot:OLL25758.1 Protein sfi1 [Neolecta irregularis DAH-3]